MTSSRAAATAIDPPISPPARRARPPRWLDLRMIIGLLLVAVCVVAGARIVSAADQTVRVWALTADLAAGTTLTESDLTTVDVRLDEHAGIYLAATSDPVGKTLTRDVGDGDLLPVKAVQAEDELVSLALSIPASHVPMTVARGDRVSLYATAAPPAGSQQEAGATSVVIESVTVAEVSERSQGALSVGSGELQVVVKVPSCAVAQILDGIVQKVLTVVEVTGAADSPPSC